MKPLRQFCATVALTLILAASTFAGDIQCGAVPPPPDPPAPMMSEMSGATSDGTYSLEPLTELTLSFLQSVLSLF